MGVSRHVALWMKNMSLEPAADPDHFPPMSATATRRQPNLILHDLEALPFAALNRLLPQIVALRQKKHPLVMPAREAWLKKRIEAGLPVSVWEAYTRLIEKRRSTKLSTREQRRVEALTERMETFNVQWLTWAKELADLRRVPLDRLLRSLNLSRPRDV